MTKKKKFTEAEIIRAANLVFDEPDDDSGAESVREFLQILLVRLWEDGESFSGKRPFGNSCWEYTLFRHYIIHDMVRGEVDEDGYIQDCDDYGAYQLTYAVIYYIFEGGK